MRLTSATAALAFLFGCGVVGSACDREPAIVVRFEASDLAGRDLARPRDGAMPADLRLAAEAHAKPGPACAADADCSLVVDGCCDCANGGKLVPALKREEAKLASARRTSCKGTMCTMMVATDKLCGQRPACVAGRCASRAARPDELRTPVLHHD